MKEIGKTRKIILSMIPSVIIYIGVPLLVKALYINAIGRFFTLIFVVYPIISACFGLYGYFVTRSLTVQFLSNLILLVISLILSMDYPLDKDIIGFMFVYIIINFVFAKFMLSFLRISKHYN